MNRRITAVLLSAVLVGCGEGAAPEEEDVTTVAQPELTLGAPVPEANQAPPSWVKVALRVRNNTGATEFCHVNVGASESRPGGRLMLGTFHYRDIDAGGAYANPDVFAGAAPVHTMVRVGCGPEDTRRYIERRFVLSAATTVDVAFNALSPDGIVITAE